MPLYDFKCENNHRFERMVKLADFEATQHCACGSVANRMISRPMIHVENISYDCPITGKMITSKYQHEENLREHGCRVYEDGETQSQTRAKAEAEANFEKAIDDSVERELSTWSSDKMEKLSTALESGADLTVERT